MILSYLLTHFVSWTILLLKDFFLSALKRCSLQKEKINLLKKTFWDWVLGLVL